MTFERSSISMHYARELAQTARQKALDDHQLLRMAGLDPELVEHSDDQRMTPLQFADLLQSYRQLSSDEFLGRTTHPCKNGTFALMARQAVNNRNLRGVYRHISRFYDLFTDDLEFHLIEEGEQARFELKLARPELDVARFLSEYLLLIWHRFPGWLVGGFTPLIRAEFDYPAPPHEKEYRLMFPCEAIFDQPVCALVFERALLDQPLVQTNETLKQHLHNAPLVWVTRPSFTSHYARRVSNFLETRLQQQGSLSDSSMDAAAEALCVTTRTLRRKLTAERTSFQALKDDLRQKQAVKLLNHRELTISQISLQLGFSDPAAFSRAFKQWMGKSPKDYRNG
ncbi:AraC family transcriptional regulator [Oceanobacter mangrovi]|uniref:AraC family transcriptional regulator n=1 Tax=Oceanobacter mangrovi TaxID=2862510 RepID=UPI001C8D5B99|nr:AraC family transcriptional regulator [Oceanobacter mangrovi]